ncbi:hypothetical protein F0562_025847 [Nyssa sinensis]|uniref:Late embryogenesis abundant protein LEA-2 subgroup domain-containing protein n=1 Tax=Nyssa sinensis TaxID=561372 RepID=A0A5J5B7E8_9ASTE|nr:hypothetical protein F0562_025847 [Nyssa sinensis]
MNRVFRKMKLLALFLLMLCLSGSSMAAQRRSVRCRNKSSRCFNAWYLCPSACPGCYFPGSICEDPRFVGGDGITFYFHGRKDQDFCLVSDPNLHINAHFIGKRNPNLKRDFTWVQSIGIIFSNHKLLVAAKHTSTWDDNVDRLTISFDDMPISLPINEGSKFQSQMEPSVTILRTSNTNHVMVEVANSFRVNVVVVPITVEESRVHGYNITDENCFAHLELRLKFYNLTDLVDGVIGQTYRRNYVSKAKVNVPMPVIGGLRKFSSSNIFATDCPASRFGWHTVAKDGATQYSTLQCISGMKGNGVVCKR